jgi:hypothetical protein
MRQGDEGIIIDFDRWPAPIQLGVNVTGWAEEDQRLVDEMAAEIVQESAGLLGCAKLAPATLWNRPPAIEARFEPIRLAERTFAQQSAHRKEVSIPPSVLKHGEHSPSEPRLINEPTSLGRGWGKRLVHDDVQAGAERGERQRHVRSVRRRDDDEIEVRGVIPEMLRGIEKGGAGVYETRLTLPLRLAGNDRGELEP